MHSISTGLLLALFLSISATASAQEAAAPLPVDAIPVPEERPGTVPPAQQAEPVRKNDKAAAAAERDANPGDMPTPEGETAPNVAGETPDKIDAPRDGDTVERIETAAPDRTAGRETLASPSSDTDDTGAPQADAASLDLSNVPLPEPKPDVPPPANEENDSKPDVPRATAPADIALKPISPAASVRAAAALILSEACEERLREAGVSFEVGPSVNKGSCGVLRPVAIAAFSNAMAMKTRTRMWCPTAEALETWMTRSVAPAAEKHFPERTLTGVARTSTYVCRNRGAGEKISEHARGSAVDIGAFAFDDGPLLVSEAPADSPEGRFFADIRKAACGPFTTVLGPGTDADHSDHFHFDLAARNTPYCR